MYYKYSDKPMEKTVDNAESNKPLFVTKFDSISKIDSIFAVTNRFWKKVGRRSYTEKEGSVYYSKLYNVKIYNDEYKVIEEKIFNYSSNSQNKIF